MNQIVSVLKGTTQVTRRCVALLSGGLDSMLAIRLMQEQGITVEGLNFKTLFTCCQDTAGRAAEELGIRVTVLGAEDDYLELIKSPRFGYGKGANPCVDCRIYMFQKALRYMEQIGADFIVSGEVIGQRPMSQKKRDLEIIAHHSNLADLLLRPLSAQLLPPTLPEREGWVNRDQLCNFYGRSRKGLIALANKFHFKNIPAPSTGCALTEPQFGRKVLDLVQLEPAAGNWDYRLLNMGRHFRLDAQTKVVVGRQESENDQLEYAHELPQASSTALLTPVNFQGPLSLILGPVTPESLGFCGGLLVRYSKISDNRQPRVQVRTRQRTFQIKPLVSHRARQAHTLASLP
ncbi:MAG: hypothetical protein VX346_04010 [Planctomycetota bacterium]|nr:hypothetical protein [Planctomycetota bacterium]